MKCWICRINDADSCEHIIKQTDLKLRFGKGHFHKRSFSDDSGSKRIQGPNSESVKYEYDICQDCNNSRSSDWDTAYAKFMCHIYDEKRSISESRWINLNNVYGKRDIVKSRNNLFMYFVKSFGCALNEEIKHRGASMPQELSRVLMSNKNTPCGLEISISYTSPYSGNQLDSLVVGVIDNIEINSSTGLVTKATWFEQFEFINIQYWFNAKPNLKLGEPWRGKKNNILIGVHDCA